MGVSSFFIFVFCEGLVYRDVVTSLVGVSDLFSRLLYSSRPLSSTRPLSSSCLLSSSLLFSIPSSPLAPVSSLAPLSSLAHSPFSIVPVSSLDPVSPLDPESEYLSFLSLYLFLFFFISSIYLCIYLTCTFYNCIIYPYADLYLSIYPSIKSIHLPPPLFSVETTILWAPMTTAVTDIAGMGGGRDFFES